MPVMVQVATDAQGGAFHFRMTGAAANPRSVRVSRNGDLDFSRQPGPILVTMRLTSPGWTWRTQNTMEFNDAPVRIIRNFVRPDNHQVALAPADGQTLTFCYANERRGGAAHGGERHDRSYYGLWVQNYGHNLYIDPIISNGGRPGAEDPL